MPGVITLNGRRGGTIQPTYDAGCKPNGALAASTQQQINSSVISSVAAQQHEHRGRLPVDNSTAGYQCYASSNLADSNWQRSRSMDHPRIAEDGQTTPEAGVLPSATDSTSFSSDSKAKFSSAKALFQDLERRHGGISQKPISNGSPIGTKRLTGERPDVASLVSRSEPQSVVASPRPPSATSSTVGSPRKAPPPLPPKPKLPSDASPLHTPPKTTQTNGSSPSAYEQTPLQKRETSPLSEMTRHFNELVNDLERMNGDWKASAGGGTGSMSNSYHADVSARTQVHRQPQQSDMLTRGEVGRHSVSSGSPNANAMRYPRITQSLRMDKDPAVADGTPKSALTNESTTNEPNSLTKPSSLYMPYWRQHSYYARRYGSGEAGVGAASGGVTAHMNEMEEATASCQSLLRPSTQTDTASSCESAVPSTADVANGDQPSALGGTAYALIRSKKPDSTSAPTVASSARVASTIDSIDSGFSSERSSGVKLRTSNNTTAAVAGSSAVVTESSQTDRTSNDITEDLSKDESECAIQRPLSSQLLARRDVDASKRISICSEESASDHALSQLANCLNGDGAASSSILYGGGSEGGEIVDLKVYPDGHFVVTVPGLPPTSPAPDETIPVTYKPPQKVSFSADPMKIYSTHSVNDYDRRNEDIDPVSSSAEYELERRLEKMDVSQVELTKGPEGLGFSIIGMGVGADAGLEKLGIFVKSITSGGAVHRDGRIRVCDQIVEVDKISLVGVTQAFAADVLRNTSGLVRFTIGRESDLENSEIAALIKQSLEQDRLKMQAAAEVQPPRSAFSPPTSDAAASSRKHDYETVFPSAVATPSTASAAVQEDRTPEPLVESRPEIDQLMSRLKQSSEMAEVDSIDDGNNNVGEKDETGKPTTPTSEGDIDDDVFDNNFDSNNNANVEIEAPLAVDDVDPIEMARNYDDDEHCSDDIAFHHEQSPSSAAPMYHRNITGGIHDTSLLSSEMSQVLNESMQDHADRIRSYSTGSGGYRSAPPHTLTPEGAMSSPVSARRGVATSGARSAMSGGFDSDIDAEECHRQAELLQDMLKQSQTHYSELDQKYFKAKKLLKDYQDREKDLLEREEVHLQQLREKDQQYNSLIEHLKTKIQELERKLDGVQRKRSSLVDAQQANEANRARVSGVSCSIHVDSSTTRPSDTSATASDNNTTIGAEASAQASDISPALAYQPAAAKSRCGGGGSTPASLRKTLDATSSTTTSSNDTLGVPKTDPLDHTAAKSKVDAVKQSQVMTSRQLPSKRPETEVMIMCHHTAEHAYHLEKKGDDETPENDAAVATESAVDITAAEESSAQRTELPSLPITAPPRVPPFRSSKAPKSSTPLLPLKRYFHRGSHDITPRDVDVVPQALNVLHWTADDVCRYLTTLGLEKYCPEFTVNRIDGSALLDIDGSRLKTIGVQNHTDRSLIKKKVKELRNRLEKEKKAIEKESRLSAKSDKKVTVVATKIRR